MSETLSPWNIDQHGVARATFNNGRHIVVRRSWPKADPCWNQYEIIVEGKTFPFTYEGREEAMKVVEKIYMLDGATDQ